ncbi:ETEC_3214 domain-containing protein [Actinacidiphila oryziradicis]|uniref:Uncharacterized protein n=1 Tax=Actinacidiphila oryziradicis TaxID=2571141 RepID=A0A4U0RHR5_9ACTN|nr:ETEC_3214 domain-containing protein [Actinacidiphila oryziradicis]TJZ95183.1 hypothetical protein FCI23_52470 [Actinacidiphila oryziradicis]
MALPARIEIGGHGYNHTRKITLGKSTLTDVSAGIAQQDSYAAVGARRFAYAETHYFGNPGGYRTWAVGVSDSGRHAARSAPAGLNDAEGNSDPERLAAYRASAAINSVLVIGMSGIDIASFLPYAIGLGHDKVRLLDERMTRARGRLARIRDWKMERTAHRHHIHM